MYKLILDTSQSKTIIALSKEDTLTASSVYAHENRLSSLLTSSIQIFLENHNIAFQNLRAIAVGIGPGSYTGTRVAVTVAKTLCYALEIPLITFNSLLLFVPDTFEGSFAFLLETKQSSPYLLTSTACAQGFADPIGHIPSALKIDYPHYFALNPEAVKACHKSLSETPVEHAGLGLNRLAKYIHGLTDLALSHDQLDSLELIYLQALPIQPVSAQALNCSHS